MEVTYEKNLHNTFNSGLQPGDSMVKAKISPENIRHVPGFMGDRKLDLKSMEVL